ncbi:MAG: CHAT domain-containing protein [Bacteroidales bacterium]|jgi:CHAT domain-containing protein/Tfp pilus assembly protein PilF|nr:CHAT domain-containing protein [Bacteroidales bacterium]
MKAIKVLSAQFVFLICSQISFAQDTKIDTTLANNYFIEASFLQDSAQFDSAIIYFEKASALFEIHSQWRKYLQSETKHGECFQKQWQLNKAIAIIKPAIEKTLLHIDEKDAIVANTYNILGVQYYYQSQSDSTLFYWKKAMRIREEVLGEKHTDVAKSYHNIGNVYNSRNEYDLALQYFFKSLKIWEELFGNKNIYLANNYIGVGIVYNNKNEYDLALEYYSKALEMYKSLFGEKHPGVGNSYNNIGNVYNSRNEYDLALQYYFKALQVRKELFGENNTSVADNYNNIGVVYNNKNENDLALDYFLKAIQIKKDLLGEEHTSVAISYINVGSIYDQKNEYDKALDYFFKALQIFKKLYGENHIYVADAYNNIGVVYYHKNEYDMALKYYFKTLQIKKDLLGEKHTSLALSYNNVGIIYWNKNEYNYALQYYQKAIACSFRNFNDTLNIYSIPIIKDYLNWEYLLEALQAKSNILANNNKDLTGFKKLSGQELALRHYHACDTLINLVRQEITTKSDKLALGELATEVYQGAIDVCYKLIEQGDKKYVSQFKDLAFYFSEKNKSSVLLEALAGAEAQKFAGIPDTLLQKEHTLQIDISLYKRIFAEQPDSAQEIIFNDKLFNANRQYDKLITDFENNYPNYFELKYNCKPASVEDIQEILDDKTAMISYFTGDSTITIFTITQNSLDINTVPNIDNFADTIKYYRNGLIYTNSKKFAETYKNYAYKFFKKLIPETIHEGIKNLIIIPDAELSMIPFETLLTEQAGEKDWKELPYFIKKYNISYSYSANLFYKTFLKEMAKKIETTHLKDWLAFAPVFDDSNTAGLTLRTRELLSEFDSEMNDSIGTRGRLIDGGYVSPLPGTETEVQEIFKQFEEKGKKALVQIKKNANEDFIKSGGLKDYKYLHFATHGFVNTEKPELSGIFLAQDSTLSEDGILYSGEIYNLKLNADLTVLSACETGLGKIKKGEGLIGLTRALLYAGSKNIIVSLWKVADDSTSDLMIDFYKNLLEEEQEKQEFSQALQQAKLKMIDEGKYAHPFYWSPFILIGK